MCAAVAMCRISVFIPTNVGDRHPHGNSTEAHIKCNSPPEYPLQSILGNNTSSHSSLLLYFCIPRAYANFKLYWSFPGLLLRSFLELLIFGYCGDRHATYSISLFQIRDSPTSKIPRPNEPLQNHSPSSEILNSPLSTTHAVPFQQWDSVTPASAAINTSPSISPPPLNYKSLRTNSIALTFNSFLSCN